MRGKGHNAIARKTFELGVNDEEINSTMRICTSEMRTYILLAFYQPNYESWVGTVYGSVDCPKVFT